MDSSPLILGHRGASALAPENTMAAFKRAMTDGADGIEFDVRLSRDQIPVVIHDHTLTRTGLTKDLVSKLTAAELQSVDVGSWFVEKFGAAENEGYRGESIPLLSDVLESFSTRSGWLYVELKCEAAESSTLVAAVVGLLDRFTIKDQVVVESFELSTIAEVKKLNSKIRTAALFEPRVSRPLSTIRRLKMIELALQHGADEIALHHSLAGKSIVENALLQGLGVVVWTVDDLEWLERARATGIKALISNNPGRMVQHRFAQKVENPTDGSR